MATTSGPTEELTDAAAALREISTSSESDRIRNRMKAILDAAEVVGRVWSGSSIGYHAKVYYAGLAAPPPRARFDPEWGLMPAVGSTTRGQWEEQDSHEVEGHVYLLAGEAFDSTLDNDAEEAANARNEFDEQKSIILSLLSVQLEAKPDTFLATIRDEIEGLDPISRGAAERAQLPSGQVASRDAGAMSQGLKVAPHQRLVAYAISIDSPFDCCQKLEKLSLRAARHIERYTFASEPRAQAGSKIFLGHGRSQDWRELRDFIERRLGLAVDEFNQVPIAGITSVDRLKSMLDDAAMAFLVLTAEDETASGELAARQNVVHEVGLFQGRLGFTRAVVMLEQGCAEFSNIHGLGQLRFPTNSISSTFESVRELLEREGLLPG